MLTANMPHEPFNTLVREGKAGTIIGRILDELKPEGLTPVERLEHRMLATHVRSRIFELEEVRTWERHPQHYSDLLSTSLAGQRTPRAKPTDAPASRRASQNSNVSCQPRCTGGM